MQLQTKTMSFFISKTADTAGFRLPDDARGENFSGDFWRLILDDGMRTEIPVCSHMQKGRARREENRIVIEYDRLLSEYGDWYDVSYQIVAAVRDDLICFTSKIENRDSVRVNECFCPMAGFTRLCGNREDDRIYMPEGLGTRIRDPWRYMQSKAAAYYEHDEREAVWHVHYPCASMSWFGIESGPYFLYLARYDEKVRYCFLTVHQTIRSEPADLILGIDHFPMVRRGETVQLPETVIGLLPGDWRAGAKRYRQWAGSTFFHAAEKAPWVRKMAGWQRIIMRSQYGVDYYTADDLPAIYEAGRQYGIDTIFLFAWWKQGMDRGYPSYEEPHPGAFRELRRNIQKVQQMGGHVILECNCHFLDPQAPYYHEFGDEVKLLDINGNEIRRSFVYHGRGELRGTYGARQFVLCCGNTERWRSQLMSQMELMRSMDADCLFADCYGGAPFQPCFNDRHEHGARVDEEWVGHRKFLDRAEAYCRQENKVFAAEVVTDIAASYTQFLHGLYNVDFRADSSAFPQMFRYTFPEVITTERGIHGPEGDFRRRLKCALTAGLRLDAELYVCRADLSRCPAYAQAIGEYTGKLEQYADYMLYGTYTVIDSSELPQSVKRGEYYSADRKSVLRILYNAGSESFQIGNAVLKGDEMRFEVFSLAEYEKSAAGAPEALTE